MLTPVGAFAVSVIRALLPALRSRYYGRAPRPVSQGNDKDSADSDEGPLRPVRVRPGDPRAAARRAAGPAIAEGVRPAAHADRATAGARDEEGAPGRALARRRRRRGQPRELGCRGPKGTRRQPEVADVHRDRLASRLSVLGRRRRARTDRVP